MRLRITCHGVGSSSISSANSSDSGEGETLLDLSRRSKNREIHWAPTNSMTIQFNPPSTGLTPVPTHYAVARAGELADSFDLFLITKLVMDNTNLHGEKDGPWCHHHVAYFGILVLPGVYRSHSEATRSLWDDKTSRHIFWATMSIKIFALICRILSFNDSGLEWLSRPRCWREDKLAVIWEIWDLWTPSDVQSTVDICPDEQLVPYWGWCEFWQYMPMKPTRYGLKMWVTYQTTHVWTVSIYIGRAAKQVIPEMAHKRLRQTPGAASLIRLAQVTFSNKIIMHINKFCCSPFTYTRQQ